LIVGLESPDDAAVWDLHGDHALVVTTDFFTPVVDDPYHYGQIAAANALSDLYAMGATPLFTLNIAAMPADLPIEMIEAIIRGGAEKVREAGAVIAGGHSIQDNEPKYGLVAVGLADKNQMMTKAMAKPGDLLVITKPLGTGVTTTALRSGTASEDDVDEVISWMSILNQKASSLAIEFDVKAATDVTGFGLLGHAVEVSETSQVGLIFHLASIPFMGNALNYGKNGHFPGGSADNRRYFGPKVDFEREIDDIAQWLLFDAQTSGGLLLAVPQSIWDDFALRASVVGVPTWPIGLVEQGSLVTVKSGPLEDIFVQGPVGYNVSFLQGE
jgi:selenide,water dikinase